MRRKNESLRRVVRIRRLPNNMPRTHPKCPKCLKGFTVCRCGVKQPSPRLDKLVAFGIGLDIGMVCTLTGYALTKWGVLQ